MPDHEILKRELVFKAVRSSGAGGQHVNKTSSKVILQYDIQNSEALNEEEKILLLTKLSPRLTKEGILILESSESRSQHKNKELVIERLEVIITNGLKKARPRKKTKPSRASKLKRLHEKKVRAEKKTNRQKPDL
ncbi:alternative ribosome rescue aminoacyl-tRNA hydrolase ArfB [soil metagenome]